MSLTPQERRRRVNSIISKLIDQAKGSGIFSNRDDRPDETEQDSLAMEKLADRWAQYHFNRGESR